MNNTENRKPIQSPEELSERLGFSISTTKKLVSNGDIESVKIGKHRYVTVGALDKYLDSLNLLSNPGIFHGEVL